MRQETPRPVVLTGAAGFVGAALAARLPGHQRLPLGHSAWRDAIERTSFRGRVVIHLAGRAHDPSATAAQFQQDNVEKTARLAAAAAAGGAERFVFLSTIKVHGEETRERPYCPDAVAAPKDPYATSKWLAEEALRDLSVRSGMPWVVVRAPLVYGRRARGNFRALVRIADTPLWLPFASIHNRRSLVHVEDLADALVAAASRPEAIGKAFLAAHPSPVSTPELVAALRAARGRPARMIAVPPAALEAAASLVGRARWIQRLTRSLEADSSSLQRLLGWAPRHALSAGLEEALS